MRTFAFFLFSIKRHEHIYCSILLLRYFIKNMHVTFIYLQNLHHMLERIIT